MSVCMRKILGGWWERLKGEIKGLSMEYSRGRNRIEREREREGG